MENQTISFEDTTEARPSMPMMAAPVTPELWTTTGGTDLLLNISGQLVNLTDILAARSNAELSDDAIWILTSTFIIFTMQSGKECTSYKIFKKCRPILAYLWYYSAFI